MGIDQLVASLISSLAWPTAATAMVLMLRRPIVRMLRDRHIKSLKAGPSGVELSFFDSQIRDANKELIEANVEQDQTVINTPDQIVAITEARSDFMTEMSQLAHVAPRAAVLESFARLEQVLRTTVRVTGQDKSRYRGFLSVRNLAKLAAQQGLLTQSQLAAFEDVAVVRSILNHESTGDLDASRALAYADIAWQLITSISSAAQEPLNGDSEDK
jgi:hypothetical protein